MRAPASPRRGAGRRSGGRGWTSCRAAAAGSPSSGRHPMRCIGCQVARRGLVAGRISARCTFSYERPDAACAGRLRDDARVRLLAFDTATPATAVALSLEDGRTLTRQHRPGAGERPGHVTELLPLAQELLAQAGIGFASLDRSAVGVGPGTFTGLRIGVATARALAQAHDLP